jgi:putative membrane protein
VSSHLRNLARSAHRSAAGKAAATVTVVAGLSLTIGAGPALAASTPSAGSATDGNSPRVVNRETVVADLSPSGSVKSSYLISQLDAWGKGRVNLTDPGSTSGLRNLDGFAAPRTTKDGVLWDFAVDGHAARRTVATNTDKLPVAVRATYTLDGKPISAADLVGKSGTVGVTYRVENVSGKPMTLSYQDGNGVTHTETANVVVPLVGQLQLTLPGSWTRLHTDRADVAGDGRGGTMLSYTMVLFEPIGSTTETFGFTAHVQNAQLPPASVQLVPITTKAHPEIGTGKTGYRDGAQSAIQLTDAGTQIDQHLIELRDGAGQLLAGLQQLAAGAQQLRGGLQGQLAPGAAQLHDGIATAKSGADTLNSGGQQLSTGAAQLSAGVGQLAAGATQLADGTATADAGAQTLADGTGQVSSGAVALEGGLTQLAGGLDQLSAGIAALPQNPGLAQLLAGVQALKGGIGAVGTPGTLLDGVHQVVLGLDHPTGAAGPADPGGIRQGVLALQAGLQQLATSLAAAGTEASGGISQMNAALADQKNQLLGLATQLGCDPANPGSAANAAPGCGNVLTALGENAGVVGGLGTLGSQLSTGVGDALTGIGDTTSGPTTLLGGTSALLAGIGDASTPNTLLWGLNQVSLGLSHPVGAAGAADPGGLLQGVGAVGDGINQLVDTVVQQLSTALGTPSSPATTLRGGAAQLVQGAGTLSDGAAQVDGGAKQLAGGLGQLTDGSKALASGAADAAAGGSEVASGAGQVAGGIGQLTGGLTQLDAGGSKLASGAQDAAAGSGQIADGLAQAVPGATQIQSGADQLHQQGSSQLAASGNEAAVEYGKKYALMQALDERASDGALPYGAPQGATGSAAYMLTLAGANKAADESTTRGALAVGLLLAGSLVSGAVIRRRVSGS